jgi:hypothetical protein
MSLGAEEEKDSGEEEITHRPSVEDWAVPPAWTSSGKEGEV